MEIREQIKVLRAFKRGATIEYYNENSEMWIEIGNNRFTAFDFSKERYRIKPRPNYIPFTFDDRNLFRGRWIKSKSEDSTEFSVNNISKDCAFGSVSYDKAFKEFIFIDGTPFGKLS